MFDTTLRDSQSTQVVPIHPDDFDFETYGAYADQLDDRVTAFREAESGVLVYRRFRVAEAYGYECRDKALSLNLQLGALQQSMQYEADIPNFLEPWYGLGIGAAAFGARYVWNAGQAPAAHTDFSCLADAVRFDPIPIEDTPIGQEQLAYIEYFLDQTKGKLPMSLSDIQSPLNIISEIVPVSSLFMDMMDDPEEYLVLARRAAQQLGSFLKKQRALIGDALVLPGHGFASSRRLKGLGASGDTSIMISNDLFDELEAPVLSDLCAPFGGTGYHSCGNWAKKIPSVLKIPNLVVADGAFTSQTDPAPNIPEDFADAFAKSGCILNVRAVGDCDTVADVTERLWRPGMKLIICTYCNSPEEQSEAYRRIHEICR